MSKNTAKVLVPKLEVADTTWSRMKGLLGREKLDADQALYIPRCSSVHTWFMSFPIDLVFVNSEMVVTKTVSRVKPWRIVFSFSRDVFELSEGFLEKTPIRVGEQLYVDNPFS